MADGRHISKIRNIYATVQPIVTKFCRNMQIAIVNRLESENLHISKIQDGGLPPYWKSKIRNISATVQAISTKFCTNMHIATANHTENEICTF